MATVFDGIESHGVQIRDLHAIAERRQFLHRDILEMSVERLRLRMSQHD
jgi:hypothetical protein